MYDSSMNSEKTGLFGHLSLCRIAGVVMAAALLLCVGACAVPAGTPAVPTCSPSEETDGGLFAAISQFFASLFSGPTGDTQSPGDTPSVPPSDMTPDATPVPDVPVPEVMADSMPAARPTAPAAESPSSSPSCLPSLTGGLLVETVPSGAWITLDGDPTGKKTPALFAGLREGVHRIEVSSSLTGDSRSDTAWVYSGAIAPVFYDFSGSLPEMTVQVESGTDVPVVFAVNGKLPEMRTPAEVTVTDTDSFIAVSSDAGYQTYPLVYRQGADPLMLTPASGGDCSIRVTSDPDGAEIFVDGRRTGEITPADISSVSPGHHRVFCSLPGYSPDGRVVPVSDHSGSPDAEVALTLEPYSNGGIFVTSEPAGARVYLYGSYTGLVTPATISGLPIGTHGIGLSTAFGTIVREIIVLPDTVTPYEFRFDE